MLQYIAILILTTLIVGLFIGAMQLYFGASSAGGLAAHTERMALRSHDWMTTLATVMFLYATLCAIGALIYITGFGAFLLYFNALALNMVMGQVFHVLLCKLIHKCNGAPVPMPCAA
jgi:hypothetical protein